VDYNCLVVAALLVGKDDLAQGNDDQRSGYRFDLALAFEGHHVGADAVQEAEMSKADFTLQMAAAILIIFGMIVAGGLRRNSDGRANTALDRLWGCFIIRPLNFDYGGNMPITLFTGITVQDDICPAGFLLSSNGVPFQHRDL